MPAPECPVCRAVMRLRVARKGRNAGKRFWGCSRYPKCDGTANYEPSKIKETAAKVVQEIKKEDLSKKTFEEAATVRKRNNPWSS
jgi:ssDNA-binding Zn-finger/Zn-ribbon topoisomerase 1